MQNNRNLTYHSLYIHLVWGTKNRLPLINENIMKIIRDSFEIKEKEMGIKILSLGGIENHIHLLIRIKPKHSISNIVKNLKGYASKKVNENNKTDDTLYWQKGFGCFSVSKRHIEDVKEYIENQRRRHLEDNIYDNYEKY